MNIGNDAVSREKIPSYIDLHSTLVIFHSLKNKSMKKWTLLWKLHGEKKIWSVEGCFLSKL